MVIITVEGTPYAALKELEAQVSALTEIKFILHEMTSVATGLHFIEGKCEEDGITYRLIISKIFRSSNNVFSPGIGIWQVDIPNNLLNSRDLSEKSPMIKYF